ncbi:uncharacterized protein LOC117644851 [Thrips palmi]|uniref:Uncharacterized protein LOC117644851 n=1 Tax=Thrips palmi TaxID=161013 RepID=A0A6P8YKK3_THRPL|nr:uncharacterized protein LOC117644851 [Thrips palmi]XP_034240389.1 uncharacterized protein LOC117644851 [Thrips palmi]XP_034240390.1 uncharacterized protein LOC117644851 [Thrips palmi]
MGSESPEQRTDLHVFGKEKPQDPNLSAFLARNNSINSTIGSDAQDTVGNSATNSSVRKNLISALTSTTNVGLNRSQSQDLADNLTKDTSGHTHQNNLVTSPIVRNAQDCVDSSATNPSVTKSVISASAPNSSNVVTYFIIN